MSFLLPDMPIIHWIHAAKNNLEYKYKAKKLKFENWSLTVDKNWKATVSLFFFFFFLKLPIKSGFEFERWTENKAVLKQFPPNLIFLYSPSPVTFIFLYKRNTNTPFVLSPWSWNRGTLAVWLHSPCDLIKQHRPQLRMLQLSIINEGKTEWLSCKFKLNWVIWENMQCQISWKWED